MIRASFSSSMAHHHDSSLSSKSSSSNSINQAMDIPRSFGPGPYRARRGGGRSQDRFSASLPKRMINYDLAESFMDHSTNPISSDLYKFRFKHSVKRWPHGRFCHYNEKLEKSEGGILPIDCMRTFPLQPKRKKVEQKPNESTSSTIPVVNSIAPEKKKKLADEQTDFYAKFFGSNKTLRPPDTNQIKKIPPPLLSSC